MCYPASVYKKKDNSLILLNKFIKKQHGWKLMTHTQI